MFGFNESNVSGARVWLLIGFVFGFAAIIASLWILIGFYVVTDSKRQIQIFNASQINQFSIVLMFTFVEDIVYPGVALVLQSFFIFFA